jgi:colicin import membrane protein
MSLIQINPTDYGLTSETAANIAAQFKPMLDKMTELEDEFNRVAGMPLGEPSTEQAAKVLLQQYVKVRTGTAAIHKEQKDFYLKGGRFVDGWKNAQLFASQGKEDALQKIVNHRAIMEQQRIERLQVERIELVRPYIEDLTGLDLGRMPQDVFEAYLSAKVKAHEDRIAAEAAAEAERRRLAEISRLYQARRNELMNLWQFADDQLKADSIGEMPEEKYEALKVEAEKRKASHEAEQARIKAEAERLAKEKADAERKAAAERAEAQRKIDEANAAARKAEQEAARIRAEQEAAARKAEQERLAKQAAEKAEAEKLAKAPVKQRMKRWVESFELPESTENNPTAGVIRAKFAAFKEWAVTQIESL